MSAYLWLRSKWKLGPEGGAVLGPCSGELPSSLTCLEDAGRSTPDTVGSSSLLRLEPDGWLPAAIACAPDRLAVAMAAAGSTAVAEPAAAVAVAVAGGAEGGGRLCSRDGDREGGGDLKTAMPNAGMAALPEVNYSKL